MSGWTHYTTEWTWDEPAEPWESATLLLKWHYRRGSTGPGGDDPDELHLMRVDCERAMIGDRGCGIAEMRQCAAAFEAAMDDDEKLRERVELQAWEKHP